MILRSITACLAAASILGAAAEPISLRDDFLGNLQHQSEVAIRGVLDNIGPDGSKAPGVLAGVIIASPTTDDPNYFYTWTRDSGLTMKMIVDEFLHGKEEFKTVIENYLKAQATLQTVSSLSGALGSGRGLGEPKFHSNLTRFNGPWGRPQRDGPALRATALITYANHLIQTGNPSDATEVKDKIWPVVQNDLNYVAQYWNETGFDLWEEVKGSSFFTTAVQHRALVEGAALGKQLGLSVTAYESQAPNVLCFLQTYWNGEHIISNINTEPGLKRTGLDANSVLTSIATFDPEAKCDDSTFQPCSARALANLKKYVDSFRTLYNINQNMATGPVATGRYAEDVYYGGQPWYLTTFAVAEQLYDAVQQWSTIDSITITEVDLPFWQSVYPSAKTGVYDKNNQEFGSLLDAIMEYADGFVKIGMKYIPSNGALSEQFSRENGTQVSARDLTWSYASFVTMYGARRSATSEYPQLPSWNSSSANEAPAVCEADSIVGIYEPGVGAGAPPGVGGCTYLITFNVNASTYFGENIFLTGSITELGEWREADALAGDASKYTQDRPLWFWTVELPVDAEVQYQYVRKGSDGKYTKETIARSIRVPQCDNTSTPGSGIIEDAWVGPSSSKPSKAVSG